MSFTNNQLIGVGVVGVLLFLYLQSKATEAVKDLGHAVNPVNPDNAINGWFDSAYQAVTGPNRTLGGDLADYFNGIDG